MKVWDLHCDTLYELRRAEKAGAPKSFLHNDLHIDLEKLQQGDYLLQCFAAYVDLADPAPGADPLVSVLEEIDIFKRLMAAYPEKIAPVYTAADLERNRAEGKLSAMLTVEEGGCCKGSLGVLRRLQELGVRMMTLTWNHENCLAYPHRPAEFQNKGLKPFGLEIVQRMDELGMVVDVSHLSDAGFWDVVKHGTRPFMATHSNSREVRNVSRNLSDEMIRALADRGGIMGLNFYSDFLSDDPVGRIDDMLRHCRHIMNVGGEQVLGLGTDFDGMETEIEVNGAGEMPKLAQAMDRAGFSTDQIEGICYRNAERFFARYWGEK